jgi:putative ABC transport system substrate-binding protein
VRRRALIAGAGAGAAEFAAAAARAQGGGPPLVALLSMVEDPERPLRVVRARLRELGLHENREVVFAGFGAGGNPERLAALAAELARRRPAVVLAAGLVTVRAARAAMPGVAIVALAGDLVGSGFAASLARPGGDVTGVNFIGGELNAKRLEILVEALPSRGRILVLAESETGATLPEIEATARALGVALEVLVSHDVVEIGRSVAGAPARGVAGINVLASPTLNARRPQIIEFAAAARLPAIFQWPEAARDGGLLAYGPSLDASYRQLAGIAARVLRGARPAEIPIEQPTLFELAVNLRTARALGLALPPQLVARADEVIE